MVVTFGGCKEDFMLVVMDQSERGHVENRTDRLLFIMSKPKVRFKNS